MAKTKRLRQTCGSPSLKKGSVSTTKRRGNPHNESGKFLPFLNETGKNGHEESMGEGK